MNLALKNKKVIIIAAAVGVSVIALGVGLGVGLSSSSSDDEETMFMDPISNTVRSEHDLLTNGITADGKTYSVVKENDKLFTIVKKNTILELSQPQFTFSLKYGYSEDFIFTVGGKNFPSTIKEIPNTRVPLISQNAFDALGVVASGEDYFYTITWGGIGHVKITNDGYIWGGFYYNSESGKIEKHEALTNGPLKFGTVYPSGRALIDLAVVNEYQLALNEYASATAEDAKATAAERMRKSDSAEGKNNRDHAKLTWKIMNFLSKATIAWLLFPESILETPMRPATTGFEDVAAKYLSLFSNAVYEYYRDDQIPVDDNKFDTTNLKCGNHDVKGLKIPLINDNQEPVCIEPVTDENGLADINQDVEVDLGDLNYRLYNFQGGHIKNPLLNNINATPDGYVTLPGIPDPVRVIKKTMVVVLPSDAKIELAKQ